MKNRPMRIRLEYFDQNDAFAAVLPLLGTVVRDLAIVDWGSGWSLIWLDQPFEYDGRRHGHVFIRPRWEGHAVGDREPTSVFILLLRNGRTLDGSAMSSEEFEHVAWGMAGRLPISREGERWLQDR